MKEPLKLALGDQVQLRKPHPCGGTEWEVLRVGMDIRLKCLTCGRLVLIPRVKLEKGIKKIVRAEYPNNTFNSL
ncbi:DUF951 domain-containing protein [Capillibacterium thermochitinicola]|uniref:DUF951 domain-containing protein n=1 Tax=Capillibacterium thermochitinicola TaxID=2699427 RepID=A0A8J6I1Q2_9FIRM|nr:DUF951 domain-containing protein [Capillibacterium thermochitinicola]MBA2133089.1 DUF951 domain-containing protein [Capillibacterium thermochitinicola]